MFKDHFRDRRVFITGHTGFKGAWLSQWLLNLGADVAGYGLEAPSTPNLMDTTIIEKDMNQVWRKDVLDIESLREALKSFQPHHVIHLAAQSLVRASYHNPALTFETNVMGTANVLDACRDIDSLLSIVNVTSDKCYENVEWVHGYREDDRMGGKDPYSASKGCSELVFSSFYRSFYDDDSMPALVSARAGNVIGGGDWAEDRIVPDCMRAWSQDELPIIRNPVAIRPWQHVLEPLSGYLWLAVESANRRSELSGEGFNFGPYGTANQNVETLVKLLDSEWKSLGFDNLDDGTPKLPEAGILKLTIEKARSVLGWEPTFDFSDTVGVTSRWYNRYYSGESASQLLSDDITEYQEKAIERHAIWAV